MRYRRELFADHIEFDDEANKPPPQTPTSGAPATSAFARPTADRGAPVAPPPGAAGR